MKRKTLTLVLCLLTVMSLVGVGFASWVISAGDSEKISGNIVVDTVTDARYTLTMVEPTIKDIILTGPDDPTDGWLTYVNDNQKGTVNLTVEYTFIVTKNDGKKFSKTSNVIEGYTYEFLSDLNIDVQFNGPVEKENDVDTKFGTLLTKNVISKISNEGYIVGNVILSESDTKATFTVTVGYSWGTLFESENPFTYYNLKEANNLCSEVVDQISADKATWADHAKYYLNLLHDIDGLANYNATITVSSKVQDGTMGAVVSKTQN